MITNGLVTTCARTLPGSGFVSVYVTFTSFGPIRAMCPIVGAYPGVGRWPRKTATSRHFVKSQAGAGVALPKADSHRSVSALRSLRTAVVSVFSKQCEPLRNVWIGYALPEPNGLRGSNTTPRKSTFPG